MGLPALDSHSAFLMSAALPREQSARVESFVTLDHSNVTLRVMIYRGYVADMPSLVILNSIEFAMPPSIEFCERMWAAGLQVIFIERPGFGSSEALPEALFADYLISQGATATAEAALLRMVFRQLKLKKVVLLGMGSANPVCYRLAMLDERIALSVYSNVVFNKDIFDVFRPKWLQQMFRQMVHSKAGVQIASMGIKFRMRRRPVEFYRLLMHQSEGDVAYLDANPADFVRAGQLFQSLQHPTIKYDMSMSLKTDPILKNGCFQGQNAVALSGLETPDHWKTQLDSEAARLSIPVAYAPHGDFVAPYASPDFFTALVRNNTDLNAAQSS